MKRWRKYGIVVVVWGWVVLWLVEIPMSDLPAYGEDTSWWQWIVWEVGKVVFWLGTLWALGEGVVGIAVWGMKREKERKWWCLMKVISWVVGGSLGVLGGCGQMMISGGEWVFSSGIRTPISKLGEIGNEHDRIRVFLLYEHSRMPAVQVVWTKQQSGTRMKLILMETSLGKEGVILRKMRKIENTLKLVIEWQWEGAEGDRRRWEEEIELPYEEMGEEWRFPLLIWLKSGL